MKYSKYQHLEEERIEKRDRKRLRNRASGQNTTARTPNTSTSPQDPFYLEAKKSLGQNFLKNKTIIKQIVAAGAIQSTETIIEIGPGTGELTQELLTKEARVIAIEKDSRAIPLLQKRFAHEIEQGKLILIEGDFLELSIQDILTTHSAYQSYKVIANIPYYITGLITRKCLESTSKPSMLIFLVQKEVAERVIQKDKKGSILSHSISVYGKPEILCIVSKGNFVPPPKVDSAVLVIKDISPTNFDTYHISEEFFFDILHAGFGHKRKKLLINLLDYVVDTISAHRATIKGITDVTSLIPQSRQGTTAPTKEAIKNEIQQIFTQISLSENSRPEELSTTIWLTLSEAIHNYVDSQSL